VTRVLGDLERLTLLDELALVHHRDPVADMADDVEVVRHEKVGDPRVGLDLQEQVQHAGLGREVERADRLVTDDELRFQRQGARDGDALALPTRELARQATHGVPRQVHPVEQLLHTLTGRTTEDALDTERLGEDAPHRQGGIERRVRVLEDHLQLLAQRAALPAGSVAHVLTVKGDGAPRHGRQSQDGTT